jgi:hypothetical protein
MTGGRSYSDAALQEAATVGRTMSEILSLLDLAPSGGNYETVRRRISALGFATPTYASDSADGAWNVAAMQRSRKS